MEKQALMTIYRSPNGRDQWAPVEQKDVPEWVKNPDVMGRLVSGDIAQNTGGIILPDEDREWYRAERVTS